MQMAILVLQNLREWYTNPVIILSVQSSEEDIVKALDNGANDYLVKPFRTGEFLARIRSALRSSTSEESNRGYYIAMTCKSTCQPEL